MPKTDNVIGVAFEMDVTDLKAGLAQTQKAISSANAEFKNTTAGMDRWDKSVAGVTAKLEELNDKLVSQKRNVAGYEAELERVKEEHGENSAQVEVLVKKLEKAKAEVARTEKSIRHYNSTLDELQSESVESITDVGRLESGIRDFGYLLDSQKKRVSNYEKELEKARKEHGETSEQVQKLTKKLNDAKDAVSKSEKAQQQYKDQLEKVQRETKDVTTDTNKMESALKDADSATVDLKGGFTVLKGTMADLVSSGIQAVISGLRNAIDESREFRQEMSYLQATTDKTNTSFDHAQEKVKQVYAVLGETDSAVEGMNNLLTAGFSGDALDQITDQLVGASIQWHDTLKFEGLADGLQETLATGKAIGPFVELLERGGMVAEDFDEGLAKCTTDAEKQNYVLQTLGKLGLSEVTEGYRETNKELVEGAEAQFDYEEAMGAVGQKAEPILTTIKQGWVDVLNAFLDSANGMNTADIQGTIKNAFSWFIDECVPVITDTAKWFIDNLPTIASLVAGLAAAMLTFKIASAIGGIVEAWKAYKLATEGATLAQFLFNQVLNMNPIVLVISLIVALVAAFITLWHTSDDFRNFWINLWDNIKEWCIKAWEAIVDWFKKAWEWCKKAWDGAVKWFQNVWKGIKKAFSQVGTFFRTTFTQAWTNIKNAWNSVVKWFQNIWNGIKNAFSSVASTLGGFFKSAWTAIKNAWSGVTSWFSNIWSKIKSTFSKVGSTLGGYFKQAWSNIKNAFSGVGSFFSDVVNKIKKAFSGLKDKLKSIGKDMMKGLIEGVKSMANSVKKAVTNAVDSAVSGVKDFLGIKSPSRLMRDEIGKMMGLGIGDGILASTNDVLKDAQQFTKSITKGLNASVSDLSVGLSGTASKMYGVPNGRMSTTNVTNNYSQVINSPKAPSRIELYRQTKNLLSYHGGY